MAYADPSVSDFKARFYRDFPYGGTNGDLTTVQDADITIALTQQQNSINQTLFANQNIYTDGALKLAAHFLVVNLRASAQGIAGKWAWLEASKGVAAVHSTYLIPERVQKDPFLSMLCTTIYGAQYVFDILPNLVGQMFSVAGGTVAPGDGGMFDPLGPWNGPDEIVSDDTDGDGD